MRLHFKLDILQNNRGECFMKKSNRYIYIYFGILIVGMLTCILISDHQKVFFQAQGFMDVQNWYMENHNGIAYIVSLITGLLIIWMMAFR